MTRSSALIVVALCAAAAVAGAQDRPAPETLARSLQQRYEGIGDFSATFTQTYEGPFTRVQSRETGTLLVKRPGRMRWTYVEPVRGKELVLTGDRIITYDPEDRLVQIDPQDATSEPALFLAGQGDVVRDFAIEYVESPVAGATALKLTPRTPQAYEHLVVAVDPDTLQLRALVTTDVQGGESTLIFTNLRENRGIADREFIFRIPRGVDVIDETGGR